MFTHNLTIILVNDLISNSLVSNNHLSQPNNYQQSIVSCRLAKTDFETCLSDFFSFVLLDGQAYIKFLTRDNNPVPYSFMLLRIMGQPPLLYLKFAFQAKATNVERHKVRAKMQASLCFYYKSNRFRYWKIFEKVLSLFGNVHVQDQEILMIMLVDNKLQHLFHRIVVNDLYHQQLHQYLNDHKYLVVLF